MRIPCSQEKAGSVLATTLIITACLGIVLASVLVLISDRNLIDQRSQAWNTAMPVLEAGIEEGFTHLRDDAHSLTANSWTSATVGGNIVYQKTRSFSNNGTYCAITLSNVTPNTAVIYSQGYVPVPCGSGYISRLVQVLATNTMLFTKAIAAKGTITLGGGASVDSFDSSNPLYSSNGMYVASLRRGNGGVVTDSTAQPAISISGNGAINGQTDTGPGGTITTGGNAAVGSIAWTSNNIGVQAGYTNDTMNVSYPDASLPTNAASWLPPSMPAGGYSYLGTNYTYQLGTGTYTYNGDFSLSSHQTILVNGSATWYVSGNINVSGQSYIYLAPGASLTLYGGGSSTIIAGGGVANGTGYAANFSYIGLANNTNVSYAGGSAFIGTIYAPDASFSISGTAGFFGSAIVNTFTDAGGAPVHYDESVAWNGLYVMTSYTEL